MEKKKLPARSYNQNHVSRKFTPGQRRVSVYWSWSYPWESSRDLVELDNRFSTMAEVRRVGWPNYEGPEWRSENFLQGIDGTLELFHRSLIELQAVVGEATSHPVAVFQRADQAGFHLPVDERMLDDTDTLLIFGLDHLPAEQRASADEIRAIKKWLEREGTCLLIAPHHDVGFSEDLAVRQMEYLHHGDALVPRQQRFGQYTRSLLEALDIPVLNKHGLHPATDPITKQLAPLTIFTEADKLGLLKGVTTFNYHPHLPHYEVTDPSRKDVHVLARQPLDQSRPHPYLQAGNTEFNSLLWISPSGKRAGDILIADSTIFTTLFGTSESLANFWNNLARMK